MKQMLQNNITQELEVEQVIYPIFMPSKVSAKNKGGLIFKIYL